MSKLIWSFLCLFLISCYPHPKLEITHDEFDASLTYILDNNILQSKDKTHEVELNIQKSIKKENSNYLIILECIGSIEIGFSDSTRTTFLIDGEKETIYPNSFDFRDNVDPDIIFESGNYITNFSFLKKIAYANDVTIKINGNRKILYSQLSLDNKINIQNFIESFIPLEEQMRSN